MDTFDGDAVKLGEVDLAGLMTSESQISGQSRRITSQRLMGSYINKHIKPPKKSGKVQKKSPSFFAGWQDRNVTLEDGVLRYSKEKNGVVEILGTLNFDLYQCFVTQDPSDMADFKITFNGNEREFLFRTTSAQLTTEWVKIIQMHITQSKGFKERAMAPATAEFWRQEQVSEQ